MKWLWTARSSICAPWAIESSQNGLPRSVSASLPDVVHQDVEPAGAAGCAGDEGDVVAEGVVGHVVVTLCFGCACLARAHAGLGGGVQAGDAVAPPLSSPVGPGWLR